MAKPGMNELTQGRYVHPNEEKPRRDDATRAGRSEPATAPG